MEEEIIELEGNEEDGFSEPEPPKAETVRLIQFIFDSKMVEFQVDWTYEQISNLVTNVMKDDGYLWVPLDEEKGTGSFVNLNNCTNIKVIEFEREVPSGEPEPMPIEEPPTEEVRPDFDDEMADEYLTRLADKYELDMFGTIFGDRPLPFLKAMLMERFDIDADKAESLVLNWRETESK